MENSRRNRGSSLQAFPANRFSRLIEAGSEVSIDQQLLLRLIERKECDDSVYAVV